ncbi:MAG: hypothetical protein AAF690_18720 [Acidobacteriota bacterium]
MNRSLRRLLSPIALVSLAPVFPVGCAAAPFSAGTPPLGASTESTGPGDEANVAPAIKEGFKSADLDVEGWSGRFAGREVHSALHFNGRLFVPDSQRVEGVSSDFARNHVRIGSAEVIGEIESSGSERVRRHELEGLTENELLEFNPSAAAE